VPSTTKHKSGRLLGVIIIMRDEEAEVEDDGGGECKEKLKKDQDDLPSPKLFAVSQSSCRRHRERQKHYQ
jgi:hypothetical protein